MFVGGAVLMPMGLEPKRGACELTHWIKMLATKPHNLSLILGTQLQRPMPPLYKIGKMQSNSTGKFEFVVWFCVVVWFWCWFGFGVGLICSGLRQDITLYRPG